MKKVTEADLHTKVSGLREYLQTQELYEGLEEGWWGDNMPTWLGGDPAKPAPAPIKVAKTKNNYAKAQAMVANLYKAAGVDPNGDSIVKSRYGLPTLPPFEQWDGTIPQGGHADWMTRNIFGRQGAADAEKANADNQTTAQKQADAELRITSNMEKLKGLLTKLQALAPATANASNATADTTKGPAAGAPAGPALTPKESLSESVRRLIKLMEEVQPTATQVKPPEQTKDQLIAEIEATMKAIMDDAGDDAEPEVLQALTDAQTALDAAKAAPAETPPQSYDSFGKPVAAGSPGATSADPTGQAQAQLDVNAEQGAKEPAKPAVAGPASWQDIFNLNKDQIKNPNLIYPNQQLKMPDGSTYTVKPGDNLSTIARGAGKAPTPPKAPVPPKAPTPPTTGQKELPDMFKNGNYHKVTGPNDHVQVSDPKIQAMQAKADKDPNNASFRTTVQEDQVLQTEPTLARIIQLSR